MDSTMPISNATISSERLGKNLRTSPNSDDVPVTGPILKLPNEILSMIAAHVNRKSLPALRGTCKLLYGNSTQSFIDKFIKDLGIMMSRKSLQTLVDISKDAEFASQVRVINIDAESVTYHTEDGTNLDPMAEASNDGKNLDMLTASSNFKGSNKHDWSIILAISNPYYSPTGFNDFWVDNTRAWGIRYTYSLNVLQVLSTAVSRCHIEVKELDLWFGDQISKLTTFGPTMDMSATIQTLKLHTVLCHRYIEEDCRLMKTLIMHAKHLRFLHLSLDMEYRVQRPHHYCTPTLGFVLDFQIFGKLIRSLTIQKFARLELMDVLFHTVDIISFLSRHMETLKRLWLTDCCIVRRTGSWTTVFTWIRNNLSLESFGVTHLSQTYLDRSEPFELDHFDEEGLLGYAEVAGSEEIQKYLDEAIASLADLDLRGSTMACLPCNDKNKR